MTSIMSLARVCEGSTLTRAKPSISRLSLSKRASRPSSVTFSGVAAFSTARVRSMSCAVILVACSALIGFRTHSSRMRLYMKSPLSIRSAKVTIALLTRSLSLLESCSLLPLRNSSSRSFHHWVAFHWRTVISGTLFVAAARRRFPRRI
jgi:hypothetical protein